MDMNVGMGRVLSSHCHNQSEKAVVGVKAETSLMSWSLAYLADRDRVRDILEARCLYQSSDQQFPIGKLRSSQTAL